MPDGSLVVVTQNAWGRAPLWEQRRESLARTFASERPDVIGLQEVCTPSGGAPSQAHELADSLGDYETWFLPARKRPDGFSEGVALLVRSGLDVVGRRALSLSLDQADPLEGSRRRVVLALTVRAPGAIVEVMVTHLSLSRPARERTMRELLAFAKPSENSGVDGTLLIGDLNAMPDDPSLGFLVEDGWVDAWRTANPGDSIGGTWPAGMPFRRIDYVWVRPGPSWRIQGCARMDLTGSDHLGVSARLLWPQRLRRPR